MYEFPLPASTHCIHSGGTRGHLPEHQIRTAFYDQFVTTLTRKLFKRRVSTTSVLASKQKYGAQYLLNTTTTPASSPTPLPHSNCYHSTILLTHTDNRNLPSSLPPWTARRAILAFRLPRLSQLHPPDAALSHSCAPSKASLSARLGAVEVAERGLKERKIQQPNVALCSEGERREGEGEKHKV